MEIGRFKRDFEGIFNPESVAVVGASNTLGKWGFVMPLSIIGGGFRGRLHLVNPGEKILLGMPAFPSLADIGEVPDLVIVTLPARMVPGVLEESAAVGARNMLVVASNFSEAGPEGAALERELASAANSRHITLIGPNTMGLFSASASLCALGAPVMPLKGNVGFVSQSGNLGVQLLGWCSKRGVGFSRFVGSGNEANTELTDYLEYLGGDRETGTIALYMEGLDDGRRFLEVAAEVSKRKPVVVLKGGRGEQGRRAVSSHSGALAGSRELFEGMFEQAGVITADTSEEFIDLVVAFSSLPEPRGGRAAVMTMGGGWGVVAADACDREGVKLARLPGDVIEKLDALLPSYWNRGNPVDLVGNLRRANHFKVIEALARCDEVDMLIIMGAVLGREFFLNNLLLSVVRPVYRLARQKATGLPAFFRSLRRGFRKSVSERSVEKKEGSVGINPVELWNWTDIAFIRHLEKLMAETGKPVLAVSMSEHRQRGTRRLQKHRVPTVPTPERAVRLAAALWRYGSYRIGAGARSSTPGAG